MLEKTLAPKPRRSKISVALKHVDLCLEIQYGEMEKGYAQTACSCGRHMGIQWNSYWLLSSTRTMNWRRAKDLFPIQFISLNTPLLPSPRGVCSTYCVFQLFPTFNSSEASDCSLHTLSTFRQESKPREEVADEKQQKGWHAGSCKNPCSTLTVILTARWEEQHVSIAAHTHPMCLFNHTDIKPCWNQNIS